MQQEIFSFKLADMPVAVQRSAVYGSLLLVIILTVAAILLTDISLLDALIAGVLATLLHWDGELVHQYGHFYAARRVGHPSTGIVLWGVLGTIRYPADEGDLAPEIHIRRAIGGPIISLIVALIVTVLAALWLIPWGGMARFLALWLLLDYWGIYTIGALFPPLRIAWFSNDGATIWHYWRQQ